ncbi:hypothetical protein F5Y08DRAFT_291266 [Xylaria arbuscula]|nr:hypothetical protein F5Y08DRAFT_291266 [Xylaria arbuscula]
MATLISEYVAQCLQDFENASLELNRLNDAACERFLDEFARFKLWAGNIGAHRRGRSSLDWRLRDASHLRDLVINLLKDIKNTLHDALSMLSQDSITHVDDVIHRSDTPISEGSLGTGEIEELGQESGFDEIIAEVNDIIGCLLRLSVSIKNPAPHDHFMSSKLIDTSYFEEYDLQHVEAKFPHANADLAHRIGKAISQRRQYFKYREAHHHKLNSGLALDSRRSEGGGAQSTIASSIPAALKDDGKSHPAFSRLDEEETSNSGASQTSYAISGPPSGRLRMPSLPERASDGPFECPFCYMMLSVTTEIQWRNHVSSDLRPYICLEIDCLTPEHQFARRHDWLEHIGQKHQRVFRCPYSCRDADFATSSQLEHHLQKVHPEVSSQRDLSVMLDLCERPMPWPEERDCPLCHQTLRSKQEYGRHVGRHQTELALFALPSNGQEEEDTDEGSDDDRMRELNEASDSDRSRLSEEDDEVRRSHMSPSPTDRSLDNDVHLAKPAPDDPPIRLKDAAPIRFKDAVGRKFSFPFHICRTWEMSFRIELLDLMNTNMCVV